MNARQNLPLASLTSGSSPDPDSGTSPQPVRHEAGEQAPCPECEGVGFFSGGAYHPDDPRCEAMWDCDNCGGTGEVEIDLTCQCGSAIDANGFCASCDDVAETGWLLAERAAYGMVK